MKDCGVFFLFILVFNLVLGQEKTKSRYQFAHTYFGLETELLPQENEFTTLDSYGNLKTNPLPFSSSTRFIIGGTHFWSHADFYVSIPLLEFALSKSKDAKISNGVLTGFKYFPFKLKANSVRPFVGVGFGGAPFQQKAFNGEGSVKNNRQWYYEGGLTFRRKGNRLFELGTRFFPKKDYNYYISRDIQQEFKLNNFSFLFSYKKLFDFTQSYAKPSMRKFVADVYQSLEENKGLSTFSVGFGYSATIPLEKIELSKRIPFLNQETTQNGNIELGFGYYLHRLDAAIRLSYRPLKQKESAYEYSSQMRTNSFAFETFKFIGDYHGFVPFVGPYLALNNYNYKETDEGEKIYSFVENKLAYGLVFGWDIRISDVDWLILRTNMRYTPNLNFKNNGLNYTNQQLEFNFIQLVYYPKRHKITKKSQL